MNNTEKAILLGENFAHKHNRFVDFYNGFIDRENLNTIQIYILDGLLEAKVDLEMAYLKIECSGLTLDDCIDAYQEYEKANQEEKNHAQCG